MNEPLFHFETVETPIRCVKIRFEKKFVARGEAVDPLLVFEDFVNKHLAKGYLHFHLDLCNVPFPSTRLIALLIALTVRARRRQGEITLSHVTDTARNNFVTFSAMSYLSLAPEAVPAGEALPKMMPPAMPVPPSVEAPAGGMPAASRKRSVPAGIKDMPVRKPLPTAASAPQPAAQPQVVDLPSTAFAVNTEKLPAAAPALSRQARPQLPPASVVLDEESPALVDIVEPPLVKEIAQKIEETSSPGKEENFQIRVESRASNLYQLCDFVTTHAALAGINEKEIGKIKIAVYEACLNVIEHAYHSRPDEWIDLGVRYSPDQFTIIIEDHGLSFEMKPPTSYNVHEVMDKRRSGGFGLHIIRRSMDGVDYHPDAINGNRLIMVKKLH